MLTRSSPRARVVVIVGCAVLFPIAALSLIIAAHLAGRLGFELAAGLVLANALAVGAAMYWQARTADREAARIEDTLRRSNRALQVIGAVNKALIKASNEPEFLQNVCHLLVHEGGYRLAWIGMCDPEAATALRPVACSGHEAGYLDVIQATWSQTEPGQRPSTESILSNRLLTIDDLARVTEAPWQAEALKRGYASLISVPFSLPDSPPIGSINLYSSTSKGFSVDESGLLVDLAGDVAYGVAALRNRSLRERAEAELRESEEKFKYLFDHSLVAKSITYPDGRMHVNEAFCRMVGRSAFEIDERHWREVTHPDDVGLTQAYVDQLTSGHVESVRFAKRYLDKSGRAIWADVSTALRRSAAGEPLYFMTNALDITEQRLAEEQLRSASLYARGLIEASLDPLVTISAMGKITDVNRATEQATGLGRTALIGTDFADYFTEPEMARAGYEQVLAQGMAHDYPLTLRHTSGRLIPVLYNATVYYGESGETQGVFAAARDITELKRLQDDLEERVEARTAELAAANKELEAFSYSVSHDLRAPLRALQGFSRLLLEEHAEVLSGEAQHYLERIRENASQMGRLIDDLLSFARLSRQPLRGEQVDLGVLVQEAWEQLAPEREGREIVLSLDALPRCAGDAALLRQVMLNLLSNALKFTRMRRPAHVEIGCLPSADADRDRVYFVKDNGIGFDMSYAGKLFGIFQRLHAADEFEGTGVGLAMVQRILHRHGGRVWAEAAVDRGATFLFTLPKDVADGDHGRGDSTRRGQPERRGADAPRAEAPQPGQPASRGA